MHICVYGFGYQLVMNDKEFVSKTGTALLVLKDAHENVYAVLCSQEFQGIATSGDFF